MAGFRLAPKAARQRRNPWQRRRYQPTFSLQSLSRTATDGFTITDSVVGATPSSGTASGGLIFLFSQGATGSSLTRTASDGFTISDSASGSVTPVSTNSFSRSCTDGFTISDAASGSVVALGAAATLVGVDLEFTALLDVELVFAGE